MATKPTIYKFTIALSDMNRDVYESLNLTVALHPSETPERMLARVLAFCLNAREGLKFTKGISSPDEPDIWARSLHDSVELWIEVGEPVPERVKKATRLAPKVKIYSFNSKAGVWWTQNQDRLAELNVEVVQFNWPEIQRFAALLDRTLDLSVSISGNSVFVSSAKGDCEVTFDHKMGSE